jgi:hypothetical protein
VIFTLEEWGFLDASQKKLYREVMLETYSNLYCIGKCGIITLFKVCTTVLADWWCCLIGCLKRGSNGHIHARSYYTMKIAEVSNCFFVLIKY